MCKLLVTLTIVLIGPFNCLGIAQSPSHPLPMVQSFAGSSRSSPCVCVRGILYPASIGGSLWPSLMTELGAKFFENLATFFVN